MVGVSMGVASRPARRHLTEPENTMGRKPRVALLSLAAASLVAVMIDWMLQELGRPVRVG
jgi:type IV secretory pathway TrbD component